jgi:hypothetical protein
MDPHDKSVRGIEKMYARVQRGYEDSERPKSGDTTFDPATVKTKEGLIGQDVYDRRHRPFQQPQAREDRHAPNYENDTSGGWVRGACGSRPDCYSEDGMKPTFDHRNPKTGLPRKW